MTTNRIYDVARDEDNAAVSGASVSLRRLSDNVEIASTTTSSDGSYGFSEETVGYPGPVKVRVTDGGGVVRERTGKSTGQVSTYFMSDLMRAFAMMTDGVFLNYETELEVTADGGGMDVNVAGGMAFIQGHPAYWPADEDLAVTANATGNPRIDSVVLRFSMPGTTDQGKIVRVVKAGTAAADPDPPALTQDPEDVWEIRLADIAVANGASSIALVDITDQRTYTSGPLMDGSVTTVKIADEAVTIDKITNDGDYSVAGAPIFIKAAVSPTTTPSWSSIALSDISNVSTTAPTSGQALVYNGTAWAPAAQSPGIDVKEAGTSVDDETTTLDFDGDSFNVTSSPAGEANIVLNYGTSAGTPAEGNHGHSGYQNFDVRANRNAVSSGGLSITDGTSQDILSDTQALSSGVTYDVFVTGCAYLSAGSGGTIEVAIDISGSVSGDLWTEVWLGTATEGGERSVMVYGTALGVAGGQTLTIKMVGRRGTSTGTVGTASFFGSCIARGVGGTT
ncbi:MAG: hypothetical protein KDA60_14060 [Planctomycetales bacterium]|nr:hypothetical protein [Planctomycetales bacterium]